VKFAYEVTAFFIGVLGYRATVYDTYIGRLIYTNPLEASLLELTGEGRALRKVELTAQCMETYSTFHLKKIKFYSAKI
jgi:hypothetical protein